MPQEPPDDPPLDGDPKDATAAVEAAVRASDEIVSAPKPSLDVRVARDAAAAGDVEEKRAQAAPPRKTTPVQEWGAAIVLMIAFMFICVAAVSFFRG